MWISKYCKINLHIAGGFTSLNLICGLDFIFDHNAM